MPEEGECNKCMGGFQIRLYRWRLIMEKISRIRYNPLTNEIEIQGSEQFVETYFDRILSIFSVTGKAIEKKPAKADQFIEAPETAKPETGKRLITAEILNHIKENREGISIIALKEKTGLTDKQIRAIIYKAEKNGKIKRVKRGVYIESRNILPVQREQLSLNIPAVPPPEELETL
jgi:hypothetical protein